MFFAHIADCHLGGWRDPVLREINQRSFSFAIQRSITERVDFVIIAGDLFNTAVPSIDSIRIAFDQLRQLKEAGIPMYFIAGSHDCSATGRSILDVIESAGLGINVSQGDQTPEGLLRLKPVVDLKTGVRLCGLLGKRGGLDKHYYEMLDRSSAESTPGPKIFLFHGSINELKPDELEDVDAMPVSLMPRGFDYYAGGHIHIVKQQSMPGYLNVVYPGPTFPNNFGELEKLEAGSFCLVRDWHVEHVQIALHPVVTTTVDVTGKSGSEAGTHIRTSLPATNAQEIVLLRINGMLREGSLSDARLSEIIRELACLTVLTNTAGVQSKDFAQIQVSSGSLDDIEERLAQEHSGKSSLFDAPAERATIKELMRVLSADKKEGEKIADFEKRVGEEAITVLR